jgi:hypothetical protein
MTRLASLRHDTYVSRRDNDKTPVEEAMAKVGLTRNVTTIVGGFAAALALARATDLVACVHERHTGILYAGMHSFDLPLDMAPFTVSLLWHPRFDGDMAHRLRACARCAGQGICREARFSNATGSPGRRAA